MSYTVVVELVLELVDVVVVVDEEVEVVELLEEVLVVDVDELVVIGAANHCPPA
jgi:hypothetical protein